MSSSIVSIITGQVKDIVELERFDTNLLLGMLMNGERKLTTSRLQLSDEAVACWQNKFYVSVGKENKFTMFPVEPRTSDNGYTAISFYVDVVYSLSINQFQINNLVGQTNRTVQHSFLTMFNK